jgi:hypothetical protein
MIHAILTALVPALGTLVDRLIPDTAAAQRAKDEMEAALIKASNEAALAQVEVNKIEAAHSSVFVAGWRPFIGWVCGVALALYYVPMFIIGMALWVWACLEAGQLVPRPELGVAEIIGLVMAMLGLGGLRTLEKMRGVARQ